MTEEGRLAGNSEQMRDILERMTDGFIAGDRSWRCTYINQAATSLLRTTQFDLQKKSILEIFPDVLGTRLQRECTWAISAEITVEFEEYCQQLDIWLEVRLYASETGVSIYFKDISLRKRQEEELKRFKEISARSNEAHFLVNRAAGITYVNQAACDWLGYTESELLQMSIPDIDPNYTKAQVQALFERSDWERLPPIETLHRRKDGSTFPVEISATGVTFGGEPYFFTVARDITERRLLEQERKRFYAAAENSSDFIGMATLEGKVLYVNPAGRALLGLESMEVVLGTKIADYYPEDVQALLATTAIPQVLGGSTWEGEVAFRHFQTGKLIEIWQKIYLVTDPNTQEPICLATTGRDITQRKRAEQRQTIQYAIARVLAEATTLTEAVPALLQALCESLGWQLGLIWSVERHNNTLHCVNSWHAITADVDELLHAKEATTFTYGEGLPGRVWASRKADWVEEIIAEGNFPRAELAALAGLKSVFGFPIYVGDEVLGVIECFSDRLMVPDPELLEMMQAIGAQIGQFMERKYAESALQESQKLFESFMNHSPVVAFIKDEAGRHIYVNSLFEELLGRKQTDLLGKTNFELFPPEVAEQFNTNDVAVLESDEPVQTLETFQTTDGERYYMSCKFPFRDGSGRLLLAGVAIDVSERVHAEKALLASEERYRTIYNQVIVGISEADETGRFINANERYCQIVGRSLPELHSLRMQDFTHPEDLPHNLELFQQMVATGQSFEIEKRYFRPDGSQVWVRNHVSLAKDDTGNPRFIVAITEDISERKRAEAALRSSKERLALAYLAAKIGTFEWNIQTNEVVWTEEEEALYGLPPGSFGGKLDNWRQAVHPEDIEQVEKDLQQAIANNRILNTEFRIIWPDRSIRWLAARGRVFYDSNGNPIRMIGVNEDISERKQAEAEKEKLLQREQAAREQAETANRIKDEFLAVLSHELRSPLNPILGWTSLLQTRQLDAQTTKRALATIERNAKLQAQLIEDLLDVSRILRGKMVLNVAPVNLATTIEAAIETVRLAAEAKNIQIKTSFSPNVGLISGDAARLQQVIWNLLTNAVKFTPEGGQVEVRLLAVEGAGEVGKDKQGLIQNSYAKIIVSDTGKGITPEFLPYVFDYFRQEDGTITRKFGGLGLGLAIVRHLIQLHGGTVRVESPGEGKGATFIVTLPLMSSGCREISDRFDKSLPLISNSLPLTGVRILVVDDEADMRDIAQMILEESGAEVKVAASAVEVLALLDDYKPNILVSDIGMPKVDGYMLMRQIRSRAPEQGGQIPAIALTAYAGEFNQKLALQAGFQMHLSKPVAPEDLIRAIADLTLGVQS